jgi:hypothetical protein
MHDDRVDLLRRLTAATPRFVLAKGERSALQGTGDIDAAAPAEDWPLLFDAAADWASDTGRGPVLACTHIPGMLVLAVVERARPVTLVQIDVLDHRSVRGTPVLRARDLGWQATIVPSGYRRASRAGEALARLVLDEWPAWKHRAPETLDSLGALLRADDGETSALAAQIDPDLARALVALAEGRHPGAALRKLELKAFARTAREPRAFLRRLAAAPPRRRCPLLHALRAERTVTEDLDTWLGRVNRAHRDVEIGERYR